MGEIGPRRRLFDVSDILEDEEPGSEEPTRLGTEVAFDREHSTEGDASTGPVNGPQDWGPAWPVENETAPEELEGRRIGDYRVERHIGAGSYAHVYRLRHEGTGQNAALKVLKQRFGADETAQRRFRQEGRVLEVLRHPNLISIYETGALEDGRPYLIMELLEGETLSAWHRRTPRVPPEVVVYLAEQLTEGLRALHEAGLVHRDLKPGNIMLCQMPLPFTVKILDLGLARRLEPSEDTRLTRSAQVLGTPAYMAPEQIRSPEHAGPAADRYALGVILYELLAGRRPFDAADVPTMLEAHARATPPVLPPSQGLERTVMGLLDKAPEQRPSLAQLSAELERLRRAPLARRRRAIAASGGAGLVVAALLVAVSLLKPSEDPSAPPVALEQVRTAGRAAEKPPRPNPTLAPTGALEPPEVAKTPEVEQKLERPPRRRAGPKSVRKSATEAAAGKATEPSATTAAEPAEGKTAGQVRRLRVRRIVEMLEALSLRDPKALGPFEDRYLALRRALTRPGTDLAAVDVALESLEADLTLELDQ